MRNTMDQRLEAVATYYAKSFQKGTSLEYDDLLQETRMAAWLAASDGSYDPAISSLRTYASNYAFARVCSITNQHRRKNPVMDELDEGWVDEAPSPEDVVGFRELIAQLPDDARMVVTMALSDAGSLANLTRTRARRAIADALGWPRGRLQRAFVAISTALEMDARVPT